MAFSHVDRLRPGVAITSLSGSEGPEIDCGQWSGPDSAWPKKSWDFPLVGSDHPIVD